jgi:hypothetical protein
MTGLDHFTHYAPARTLRKSSLLSVGCVALRQTKEAGAAAIRAGRMERKGGLLCASVHRRMQTMRRNLTFRLKAILPSSHLSDFFFLSKNGHGPLHRL